MEIEKIKEILSEGMGDWETAIHTYMGEDENGKAVFSDSVPKIRKVWTGLLPHFHLSGWGDFFDGGHITLRKIAYYFQYAHLEKVMIAELRENRIFGKKEIVKRFFRNEKLPSCASARMFELATK